MDVQEYDSSDDSNEDSTYIELEDSDYNIDNEDNELFDENVDHDIDCNKKGKQILIENEVDEIDCVEVNEIVNRLSSDEDIEVFPRYDPQIDSLNKEFEFKLSMIFSNGEEFKNAVRLNAIHKGKEIKFAKNDRRRIKVICKANDCPWVIWASPMQEGHCFQIKTYNSNHTCGWTYYNSTLNSKWLAKTYVHKFKHNPKLQAKYFRDETMTQLRSHISRFQASRARTKALRMVQGTNEEQYQQVWRYCEEIISTNEGSTIVMKMKEDSCSVGQPQFLRMYVCFHACKQGFLTGCRRVIGIDECHLKGQGGQILSAVGVDANNNMYPIAWALVESETKAAWTWFLFLLKRDISSDIENELTFISDKQKGLIEAVHIIFPEAAHRFCVRHMLENFQRAGFKGEALKGCLWGAALATTIHGFDEEINKMNEIDPKAVLWLCDKPAVQWSRAHFSTHQKCDILLNNLCESFNNLILEARDKPVLTLFETIRNIIMVRLDKNRDQARKWQGKICPKIKQILHKNMKDGGEFIASRADQWNYQVTGVHCQNTVNLFNRTCSCRRFELTGIPCKHACAALWRKGEEPEDYVNVCYSIDTYLQCYEHVLMPTKGEELWPTSEKMPPLPPSYPVRKGRPQTLRRRGPNEKDEKQNKMKRRQTSLRCSYCHTIGHNARGCLKKKATTNASMC